jgi:hypothetical protein
LVPDPSKTSNTVSRPITGDERRQNFALLQAIADAVGKEFEARPYEELVAAESLPAFTRVMDGVQVEVSARARRRPDNAVSVAVEFRSDLPIPIGARPSYTFRKRPDGSVF